MYLTNAHLKIIRYISRHKNLTYKDIQQKFNNFDSLDDYFFSLVDDQYIEPSEYKINRWGDIHDIPDDSLYTLTDKGIQLLESKKIFTPAFLIKDVLLPIVLAIITTLITLCLSHVL